jgi:hypothetical protein
VARKLFNFCLVCVLVLGCWGGALAAAVCPHLGCQRAAEAQEQAAAHGEHSTGEAHEPATGEEHSAHAEAGQAHAGAPPSCEGRRPAPEGLREFLSSPHDPSCSHCVGGPRTPLSTKSEWPFHPGKKVEQDAPLQVVRCLPSPARLYVREITPAQHAPPGPKDLRLLLSVFLI